MEGHVPQNKSGEELSMTALLSEINVNEIVFGTTITQWTLEANHVVVNRGNACNIFSSFASNTLPRL